MTLATVDLTPRQASALLAIRAHVERHGYPPSVRELAAALDLASTASAHALLRALERKGHLRRDPNRIRALVVVGDPIGDALRAAADKLDAQAAAHGEGIHDYTDLLRVWADDPARRQEGC